MKYLFILVVFCFSCIGMKAQPAVGSVKGALTVNDMGAAVYSMTFDAPNGGRMTPTVGLAYNSQSSGYGLAGYGIDVTGISVITSGGRDMFHNGRVRGAKYDSDCNLYLDGKRLVLQEGEDGMDGAVYSPEGNPHTKVTLHYGVENCGASYFSVSTNDGTTYTYGNYSDSKLRTRVGSNDRVAAWYICEARNKYGESIQYKYTGSLRLVPSEITYGGTDRGIRAKIEFTYKTMASGNERPFHIGNWSGTNDTLLSSVTTSINDQTYRRYDLTYDETASDKFSRLTTITESNGAGETLNPTVLTWDISSSAEITHTDVTGIQTKLSDAFGVDEGENSYMTVDLNGDGIADVVRVCNGKTGSQSLGWTLYQFFYVYTGYIGSDNKIHYSSPSRFDMPRPVSWVDFIKHTMGSTSVMDYDGDGYNDLVFPVYTNLDGRKYETIHFLFGKDVVKGGYGYQMPSYSVTVNRGDESMCRASLDINGDGRDDLIGVEKVGDGGNYRMTLLSCKEVNDDGMPQEDYKEKDITLPSNPKRLFMGDYNNDGLADLLVACENGYKVFFNNGYTKGQKQLTDVFSDDNSITGTSVKDSHRMEQGDFDGDGLVDIFCYNKNTQRFSIARNNGDGSFSIRQLTDNWGIYDHTDSGENDNKFAVVVTDFDNDGKSDVLLSKAMYSHHGNIFEHGYYRYSTTFVRWLRSTGNGLELTHAYEYADESKSEEGHIISSDFDGDGKAEIASIGFLLDADNSVGSESTMHIYKAGTADASRGRMTSVKDGFGNKTEIDYAYATRKDVYSQSEKKEQGYGQINYVDGRWVRYTEPTIDAYPVNRYTLPIALVSSVKSADADNSYSYKDLRLHIAGRGMMGFGTTIKTDNIHGVTETREATKWNTKHWLPTEASTTIVINETGETSTVCSEYDIYNYGIAAHTPYTYVTDYDGNKKFERVVLDYESGIPINIHKGYGENFGYTMWNEQSYSDYTRINGIWLPCHKDVEMFRDEDGNSSIYYEDYTYDSQANMTRKVITGMKLDDAKWDFEDGSSIETDYTYDRWGNVTSETFHGNDESTGYKYYEYDRTGRFLVKTYTVPESTTTSYTYDVFGNVLTETDETNSSNPLTTVHTYDSWGRRKHTVYPDGTETFYYTEWDNDDNIGGWFSEERHTGAPWTRVTYDSHGREIATTTVGPNYINVEKNTEYNEKGQVSKITNIYGKRTTTETFTYDARGRVLTDTHSSGASTTYEYGRNTVYVKDAAGRTTMKTYDPWGNVKTVTDNEGNIVEYQYGSHGNPVNVTTGDVTVTMEYDELGRRTKLVDPDAGTVTTTYGKNGQVSSETDGRGVKTTYTYDALGRVTQRKREDTTNKWVDPSITSYTYGTSGNSKGRIVKKDCDGKAVSYEYDMYGWVTRESRGMAYNHDYTYDELRKTYKYDSYGRLATVTYPASHSSKGITIGYRYDTNGNVTKVLFDNRLDNCLSRNYSNDGLRREIRSAYLGKTVIDYDNDGYPVSKSYEYINSKNNRGISDALSFSWDKTTGNLLSKTINGKTETYSYDNLDRLTAVSVDGIQTMKMEYAGNGNIESKTGIGEYTYYDGDKPHAVREVENVDGIIDNRDVSTQYALNGKVTSIWNKDYTAYSWYEYGPDDEKWSSWGWSPDDMGLEWDVDRVYWGNYERLTKDYHIREYYFLDNDVFLIRENSYADSDGPYSWDENFYQMERDNIGNIVAIYDLFHRKVFEAEYDAWGKQTVIKDDICFNHGFTGHEMLPGVDLIHMDGRVYDPTIGRFLSPDNYVQLPENSQSFNRYSYCINNPLKYTDPSGQSFLAVFAFATNFISNLASGDSFWAAYGKSYISTTLSSGIAYGIGEAFGATGNFGHELLRAGAHGFASGVMNALQGENFGAGFASGAFASFAGSGAQWAGFGGYGVLGATTMFGGIGSSAFGGDFLDGAMTGLNIGLYNHCLHIDAEVDLPEVVVTGRARRNFSGVMASMTMACLADDAIGLGVIDDVLIPAFAVATGATWTYEHRADIEKCITRAYNSISTMATKTMECKPGYVYHLVARTDGLYPNVRGGNVHLKAGDTWKIGETVNGQGRYTQKYLENLKLKMEFRSGPMTDKCQLWIEEKRQLIKYASQHGSLPPGNKMFK